VAAVTFGDAISQATGVDVLATGYAAQAGA